MIVIPHQRLTFCGRLFADGTHSALRVEPFDVEKRRLSVHGSGVDYESSSTGCNVMTPVCGFLVA